jgi:phosphoglycerate dehydrogenase-like enzyme
MEKIPVKLVSLGVNFTDADKRTLLASGCDLRQYDSSRDLEAALQAAGEADAVCISKVWLRFPGPDFISRLGRCRLVVTGGAACPLDPEEAARRGISIAHCPGYSAPAIAEYAFALLLTLARKLGRRMERPSGSGLAAAEALVRLWKGAELHGKTLGIAGYGAIGRYLALIARGFDMKVLVVSRERPWWPARVLRYRHVHFVEFADMLRRSDVVVSVLPDMGAREFFGAEAFAGMRRGCLFVNVGNPQVIDETELKMALEQGQLAGAGLDGVSPMGAQMLRPLANVLLSPRMGWNTAEAGARFSGECARSVIRFFSGRPVRLLTDASRMAQQ